MKFISNQEEDAVTTSAIDAKLLAEMFFAGAANLEANKYRHQYDIDDQIRRQRGFRPWKH